MKKKDGLEIYFTEPIGPAVVNWKDRPGIKEKVKLG